MNKSSLLKEFGVSSLMLLLVLTTAEIGAGLYRQAADAEASASANQFAANLATNAQTELNSIIHLSSGLSAYFTVNAARLDDDEILEMLGTLYRNSQHTKNFGVAIGYVLKYVYPIKGNEAALGLDYRSVPAQFEAVKSTIEYGKPTLTRRLNLVQGGQAVIYRAPVFVGNEYWGLLSTVVDINSLLKSAFEGMADSGYRYAVIETMPGGAVIWGDTKLSESSTATETYETDFGWQFAVSPIPDERTFPVLLAIRIGGLLLGVSIAFSFFSSLRHKRELMEVSRTDPLTQLANRRAIDEVIAQRFAVKERNSKSGFSLIFIDLDGFKEINDTRGHRAGDAVLIEVAKRIKESMRNSDFTARWGGDEFTAVVEDTEPKHIETAVKRAASIFENPVDFQGSLIPIGGSIGYSIAGINGQNAEELVAHADRQMYLSKNNRKLSESK